MIVAFYGHKGGSGRSAAVANVAPVLSRAGYRVVVVDFDLEAPGLHRFFGWSDEDTRVRGGVIDYVDDYARALENAITGDPVELPPIVVEDLPEPKLPEKVEPPEADPLEGEVLRERIFGVREFGGETPMRAWLKLIPAGRIDERYRNRVAAIDWAERFDQPAWQRFFQWFKGELLRQCDIVLLDSRAGVTDMGALCLFGLADRVVLLTPPTQQGLDGTIATARALITAGAPAAKHGALFVPSRISGDADGKLVGAWFARAKKAVSQADLLGLWNSTERAPASEWAEVAARMVDERRLPEVPAHSVGEPLVSLRLLERGLPLDPLAEAYERLGGLLRTWLASSSRESALLTASNSIDELREKVDRATRSREIDQLPALHLALADAMFNTVDVEKRVPEIEAVARRGIAYAELTADPARLLLIARLADVWNNTDRYEEAIALLEPIWKERPEELDEGWGRVGLELGRALADLNRVEQARAVLNVVSSCPTIGAGLRAEVVGRYGLTHRPVDNESARTYIRLALRLATQGTSTYALVARWYADSVEEARDAVAAAMAIRPRDPTAIFWANKTLAMLDEKHAGLDEMDLMVTHGGVRWESSALSNLLNNRAAWTPGAVSSKVTAFKKAFALWPWVGAAANVALAAARHDVGDAIRYCELAEARASTGRDVAHWALLARALAGVADAMAPHPSARGYLARAEAWAERSPTLPDHTKEDLAKARAAVAKIPK